MNKDQSYDVKPIQKAVLDIYKEFHCFCKKYGIHFFAAYGTALGAVRHHGFIPWDDDFDVFIPREDYERLWEHRQQLPSHIRLVRAESDPDHNLPFGKIIDTRADVLRQVQQTSKLNCEMGIFIDLFVMDGLPASRLGMLWFLLCRSITRHMCDDFPKYPLWVRKMLRKIRKMFGFCDDQHENLLRCIKLFTRRKYDSSEMVGPVCEGSIKTLGRWWRRSLFEKYEEVKFEDTVIPLAIGSDEILRSIYGEYMQLPPLSQRKPSHQVLG